MDFTPNDLEELRKKVAEREKIIKAIFVFVESFVLKHGRVKEIEEHSDHTHVVRELIDFNGLSFFWSTGNTCMGGNDIQIYYRRKNLDCVFSMSYWVDIERCEVADFSGEPDWQKAFAYAARHRNKILAEKKAKQSEAEKAALAVRQKEEEASLLRKRAEKLGL